MLENYWSNNYYFIINTFLGEVGRVVKGWGEDRGREGKRKREESGGKEKWWRWSVKKGSEEKKSKIEVMKRTEVKKIEEKSGEEKISGCKKKRREV